MKIIKENKGLFLSWMLSSVLFWLLSTVIQIYNVILPLTLLLWKLKDSLSGLKMFSDWWHPVAAWHVNPSSFLIPLLCLVMLHMCMMCRGGGGALLMSNRSHTIPLLANVSVFRLIVISCSYVLPRDKSIFSYSYSCETRFFVDLCCPLVECLYSPLTARTRGEKTFSFLFIE